MAKRSWEEKMLALRRAWSSAGGRNPTTDPDGSTQATPHGSHGGHGAVNDMIGAGMDPVGYLQHRLLFGRALSSNSERSRVWSQLRDFHAAMLPLSDILNKFSCTFWSLPLPVDVDEQVTNWQIRLECCCLFHWLVKDSKPVQLEALLLAFYWPEIQQKPGLLDMVSTARTALSQRDRIKKLVRAWLLLHTLSLPLTTPPTQQRNPDLMPRHLLFRYVQVYRAMQNIQPSKKSDKRTRYILGGSLDDVQVMSALTGEHLLSCSVPSGLEDDHSFVDLVRVETSHLFSDPYYSTDILYDGHLVDDDITWADLGCPKHVELLRKPKVLDWTQEFFEAVEAGDLLSVQQWLKMGQDPDSTVIDSALSTAVRHCHYPIALHTAWLRRAFAQGRDAWCWVLRRPTASPPGRSKLAKQGSGMQHSSAFGGCVWRWGVCFLVARSWRRSVVARCIWFVSIYVSIFMWCSISLPWRQLRPHRRSYPSAASPINSGGVWMP